jgi:hypothetical protein
MDKNKRDSMTYVTKTRAEHTSCSIAYRLRYRLECREKREVWWNNKMFITWVSCQIKCDVEMGNKKTRTIGINKRNSKRSKAIVAAYLRKKKQHIMNLTRSLHNNHPKKHTKMINQLIWNNLWVEKTKKTAVLHHKIFVNHMQLHVHS